MALRRPLVRINGRTKELPSGDDLPVPGVSLSSIVITIVPARFGHVEQGASVGAALPSNAVECWLSPNSDFDADDLSDVSVVGVADTGVVNFTLSCDGPIVGDYLIRYRLL